MKQLISRINLALSHLYKDEELTAITRAICCDMLGFSPATYYIKEKVSLTTEQEGRLNEIFRRLLQARELIASGQAPGEVYQGCGFGDYANFYRAFKGEYGVSPREFAAQIQ